MRIIAGVMGLVWMVTMHPYSAPWSVHVADFAIGYLCYLGIRSEVNWMLKEVP